MKSSNRVLSRLWKIGPLICASALYGVSSTVSSFELLSEGAMSSVSAVSGPFVQEQIAEKKSAEENNSLVTKSRKDDYEPLPFSTSISLDASDTDKVSVDLDFALTTEVESWAEKLRVNEDERFQLSVIDVLPFSKFDIPQFSDDENGRIRIIPTTDGREGSEYQLGKLDQSVNVFSVSNNAISYEVRSHVDRAATINASPFQDGLSYGSTYLSDITTRSFFTVSTHE